MSQGQFIDGGTYVPLYGADSASIQVDPFKMDTYPVSVAEFSDFLESAPKWQPQNTPEVFADGNYLQGWNGSEPPKHLNQQSAVTSVSWYAANAYCKYYNKRLPTMDEWEYAAMASPTNRNAQADSAFNQWIIHSYEIPKTHLNPIGQQQANYWGIHDLHGLVWEWTFDFNSVLISGESRKDGSTDRTLFCASGSVGANDLMDYAAFMRYAFRGSIKANYSIKTLGFRCVEDPTP